MRTVIMFLLLMGGVFAANVTTIDYQCQCDCATSEQIQAMLGPVQLKLDQAYRQLDLIEPTELAYKDDIAQSFDRHENRTNNMFGAYSDTVDGQLLNMKEAQERKARETKAVILLGLIASVFAVNGVYFYFARRSVK